VHDAGPALKRLRRFESPVRTAREREGAIERLGDRVQRRAYSPCVLHSTKIMATKIMATGIMAREIVVTRVMVTAILRLGESGPQRS